MMSKINKMAIFCGSKHGNNEQYAADATELANILAKHGVELIYGGGSKGLMGVVADTVMAAGGIVRGVIPKVLTNWEHQHNNLSELLVVDDMHIRKRTMYELCDAVIILPGGFGTLDELFEVLTWNTLSIHNKKVFILNTAQFFDRQLAHMQFVADEGFLWGELNTQYTLLTHPAEIEKFL